MSARRACKVGIKMKTDWGVSGLLFASTILPHLLFRFQFCVTALSAVLEDEAEKKHQIQNGCEIHDELDDFLLFCKLGKLHHEVDERVDEGAEGENCVGDQLIGSLKIIFY